MINISNSKKLVIIIAAIIFISIFSMTDYDDRLTDAIKSYYSAQTEAAKKPYFDKIKTLIDKEAIVKRAANMMISDSILKGDYDTIKLLRDAGINLSLVDGALKLAKDQEASRPNSAKILKLFEEDPNIYTVPELAVNTGSTVNSPI